MIAAVSGEVVSESAGRLNLRCGPVTLDLHMPTSQSAGLMPGKHVELHTHFYFSSNSDQMRLYAFSDWLSRDLFVTLISGSGVGPRVALALMDLGTGRLVSAVQGRDEKTLTTVSGVGPKLAKKILVELSDKVEKDFAHAASAEEAAPQGNTAGNAIQAVTSLGYTLVRAEQAVRDVLKDYEGDDVSEIVRLALVRLNG